MDNPISAADKGDNSWHISPLYKGAGTNKYFFTCAGTEMCNYYFLKSFLLNIFYF